MVSSPRSYAFTSVTVRIGVNTAPKYDTIIKRNGSLLMWLRNLVCPTHPWTFWSTLLKSGTSKRHMLIFFERCSACRGLNFYYGFKISESFRKLNLWAVLIFMNRLFQCFRNVKSQYFFFCLAGYFKKKPVSQSRQLFKKLHFGNKPTSARGTWRIILCRSVKYLINGVNIIWKAPKNEKKDTSFSSAPFTPKLKQHV